MQLLDFFSGQLHHGDKMNQYDVDLHMAKIICVSTRKKEVTLLKTSFGRIFHDYIAIHAYI